MLRITAERVLLSLSGCRLGSTDDDRAHTAVGLAILGAGSARVWMPGNRNAITTVF